MPQVNENNALSERVGLQSTSSTTIPPDLAPSKYWLFADLKKMLQGKRLGSNEEVIAAIEAYFEAKNKSLYQRGIEKLENCWSDYIIL